MSKLTITTTDTNAHGETIPADRHTVPATIDRVRREAVTEGTNERKGYDLVAIVKFADVKAIIALDLMNDDFTIEYGNLTYELATVEEQYGFGGVIEHYTLKARLA